MSDTQQEAWLVDTDTDHEGAELQVHAPLLAPGEGVEHHLTSLSLARRRDNLYSHLPYYLIPATILLLVPNRT